MQQIALCGGAGCSLDGVDVPADLAAVFGCALGIIDIGFEVHDSPGVVLDEGQVDDGVEDAEGFVFQKDREFAVAAFGFAGSLEQGMLQCGGYGLRGRLDFFGRRIQ